MPSPETRETQGKEGQGPDAGPQRGLLGPGSCSTWGWEVGCAWIEEGHEWQAKV